MQASANSGMGKHEADAAHRNDIDSKADMLGLPELEAVDLRGGSLRVVATTSIIGDVVGQVGREAIELTVLMGPGQDPHSYRPGPRDLTAVAQAHVIFINGWDLEESLVQDVEETGGEVPIVAISANIAPRIFGADLRAQVDEERDEGPTEHAGHQPGEVEHAHEGSADPHVWFSVHNVEQWVANVELVLSRLDPVNAEGYASNAVAYLANLQELEAYVQSQIAQIPEKDRLLVTNHDSLGYFADAYGFTVLGTIIPAASALAEPSASDLAQLIDIMREHGVCAVFAETSHSDTLARTVAADLAYCDEVRVVQLYTGAIGPAGSGADSYIGMFRANVDAIVEALLALRG